MAFTGLYSPLDEGVPVEVVISIMEHETSFLSSDKEKIRSAMLRLNIQDIGMANMDEIYKQETWLDFKSKLTEIFAREKTSRCKAILLKNLVKRVEEDCHHYIIRVRYIASLLIRLEHLFDIGEDGDYSRPLAVDLGSLFPNLEVIEACETALGANIDLSSQIEGLQWGQSSHTTLKQNTVTLKPMQIRTFILTVRGL